MIKVKAFAKFDLAIHIDPTRSKDELYPVRYLNCQLDLADELTLEKASGIKVICHHPQVPQDQTNFVFQAANLFQKITDKNFGAKITLVKNIPVKAGFGGGSADAAATIRGLCQLWGVTLTQNQLANLARQLGKDFYYSLHGGLCEIKSVDKNYHIKPLASRLPQFWLTIIIPHQEKPGTGWMYKNLKPDKIGRDGQKLDKLKKAIQSHNRATILKNLHNDFEKSVSDHFPVIDQMKNDLARFGAQTSLLAGAGLAVVGFFDNQKSAQKAKEKLAGEYKQILISHLRDKI